MLMRPSGSDVDGIETSSQAPSQFDVTHRLRLDLKLDVTRRLEKGHV